MDWIEHNDCGLGWNPMETIVVGETGQSEIGIWINTEHHDMRRRSIHSKSFWRREERLRYTCVLHQSIVWGGKTSNRTRLGQALVVATWLCRAVHAGTNSDKSYWTCEMNYLVALNSKMPRLSERICPFCGPVEAAAKINYTHILQAIRSYEHTRPPTYPKTIDSHPHLPF